MLSWRWSGRGGTAPAFVPLDAAREAQAADNAARAAEDDTALAYIGDFHSAHVAQTAPVLGRAGLVAVVDGELVWDLASPA